MKSIYKITNIKNGKIYIGQSNNPKIRFSSHMSKRSSSKSLSNDVDKYGRESFTLEILEETENFRKKEIEWINYYKENGYELYNKTKGGEEPPTMCGYDSKFLIYNNKKLIEVIDLLKNTNYSYSKIGKITNTSGDFARRTNDGKRKINGMDYPIRKENHFDYIARHIIEDLINTDITQKEISKKYGVARSMVTMINIGQNRHDNNINYPIRKENSLIDKCTREKIKKRVLNGENKSLIAKDLGHYDYIKRLENKIKRGEDIEI